MSNKQNFSPKQKSFIPIVFILVILVLSGGIVAGAYYIKQSGVSTAPLSDESKDWKIYTNSQQKYLIKYPPKWSVYSDATSYGLQGYQGYNYTVISTASDFGGTFNDPNASSLLISIVGKKNSNQTLSDYAKQVGEYFKIDGNTVIQIQLGGLNVLKYKAESLVISSDSQVYLIDKNDYIYVLITSVPRNGDGSSQVEKIISTINFSQEPLSIDSKLSLSNQLTVSSSAALTEDSHTFTIQGQSMAPNYQDKQVLSYTLYNGMTPNRGDVVIFPNPQNKSYIFAKRIIGLPADTIKIHDGQVIVNGKILNEPYLELGIKTQGFMFMKEDQDIVVPAGQYIVMGDNRPMSSDSREWGFVEGSTILGRLTTR